MKYALTVLLAITAISLLVFATKTYSGGPPDNLYGECADPSDRTTFRMQRNMCDEYATGLGYNVGIWQPDPETVADGHPKCEGLTRTALYRCYGAPHQEETCPGGGMPPCPDP